MSLLGDSFCWRYLQISLYIWKRNRFYRLTNSFLFSEGTAEEKRTAEERRKRSLKNRSLLNGCSLSGRQRRESEKRRRERKRGPLVLKNLDGRGEVHLLGKVPGLRKRIKEKTKEMRKRRRRKEERRNDRAPSSERRASSFYTSGRQPNRTSLLGAIPLSPLTAISCFSSYFDDESSERISCVRSAGTACSSISS